MHKAQVHERSSKADDTNEDLKKLIEAEVRKQIWPTNGGKKISNAKNVGKLYLPNFPDDGIVRKYTEAPAKATDSDIEERLNCLKYDDTDAKKFMMIKSKLKILTESCSLRLHESPKLKMQLTLVKATLWAML